MIEELLISTNSELELIDITKKVEEVVSKYPVKRGICHVFAAHATASIIVNENEEGLLKDILNSINSIIPKKNNYFHDRIDNNARSHIASALLGQSRTFPIIDSKLTRGTWQNIFLLELDGPRTNRKVIVQLIRNGNR